MADGQRLVARVDRIRDRDDDGATYRRTGDGGPAGDLPPASP